MREYRSQKDARTAEGKKFKEKYPEIWPICVPSYNRPHPKIVNCADPSLPLVFFVRREQLKDYRYLREMGFRVVPIDNVHDLGETRAKIVKWAEVKGYDNIFMLDDDITSLDYLYPGETRGGQVCMRASKLNEGKPLKGLSPTAFRVWMLWLDRLGHVPAMSAPLYRPDSWHMKNAGAPMRYNSGAMSQCIHLNVKKLKRAGVKYVSNAEGGVEDYALQFKAMTAGLKTVVLTDLVYDCPPINSGPGGCEGANGYQDALRRYKFYYKQFIENVCGPDHPGILKKVSRSGYPTIKFNWSYWRGM